MSPTTRSLSQVCVHPIGNCPIDKSSYFLSCSSFFIFSSAGYSCVRVSSLWVWFTLWTLKWKRFGERRRTGESWTIGEKKTQQPSKVGSRMIYLSYCFLYSLWMTGYYILLLLLWCEPQRVDKGGRKYIHTHNERFEAEVEDIFIYKYIYWGLSNFMYA